jgi:hypothetical protein
MSRDRFIWFDRDGHPGTLPVGTLIEDYLGAVAESVEWKNDRWEALLPGRTSHPLKRLEPHWSRVAAFSEENRERWIEVVISDTCIDVLTRQQDEATNAIADGLARLIARHWGGALDADFPETETNRLQTILSEVPVMFCAKGHWTADELQGEFERLTEVVSCRLSRGPCTCGAHVSDVMTEDG